MNALKNIHLRVGMKFSKSEQKTILVTGGAGFIGSHLCEQLVKDANNTVFSLDNYFTGSTNNHIPAVNYIKGDTANISDIIDFCPDLIYHLGEYSRVEQSFFDVEKVWTQNIQGTFNVLQFAKNCRCKIIYAASSTKFGDNGNTRNDSPYAWTKATNSELVANYGSWFNIPYAIVYFYNVYGGREITQGKYATLIAIFTEKMRKGEALPVVSPGDQKRNFTHISDVIDGIITVSNNGQGDGFGIGHPQSFSILEVANMFGGKVEIKPERKGNRNSSALITDMTNKLGWSAKHSLKEYIENLRKNKWEHNQSRKKESQ